MPRHSIAESRKRVAVMPCEPTTDFGETADRLPCIFHCSGRNHCTSGNRTRMKLIRKQVDRILALMLVSSLAACDSGSQQTQVDETASAQPTETPATADEGSAMEDRFANMFVSEVTDTFNPGLQIGERFPAIRALYQGEEITAIDRFVRDRGAIFIAARSVDW